jgi:hypothetical protein
MAYSSFCQKSRWNIAAYGCNVANMGTIELSQFTLREKFQIMQSIWEELRASVDRFEVPQSHKDLLDARRRRVESGESKILDWDQVKHTIGRR